MNRRAFTIIECLVVVAILAILAVLLIPAVMQARANAAKSRDIPVVHSDRVTIEEVSILNDSTAYNGRRKVFIIRDNKTGREFIGIAGVGVSDVGSHSTGPKAEDESQDER